VVEAVETAAMPAALPEENPVVEAAGAAGAEEMMLELLAMATQVATGQTAARLAQAQITTKCNARTTR